RTSFRTSVPRLKAAGADIFFGDEAAVRSDYHTGTTWAPVSVTPVENDRCALQAQSDLCYQSEGTVAIHVHRRNRHRRCLHRVSEAPLLQGTTRTIFLVVDCYPVHRSAKVRNSSRNSIADCAYFACRPTRLT
ncbi:transposase, fragmentary gene, partial [Aromatoleum aromaticum EbN1]